MSEAIATERRLSFAESGLRWWPVFVIAIVADLLTKEWILRNFMLHEAVPVLPVLDILRAHNPGAAFSFLADAGGWQRWFFTVLGIGFSVYVAIALRSMNGRHERLQSIGLLLVASGAMGNVLDRLRHGYVVDFIAAHWGAAYFPAFNVADSCITIGAGLVLLDMLLRTKRA
jgi:signal peptidase II